MSDLISRSELLSTISNMNFDFGNDTDDTETIIEMVSEVIKEQLIAYSVGKVVEELEKEAKRWEDSGKRYEDECEIAVGKGLRKAIEIVKQGDVSDDVCECRLINGYKFLYKTSCGNTFDMENNFKYCPYCGKKIKVVE